MAARVSNYDAVAIHQGAQQYPLRFALLKVFGRVLKSLTIYESFEELLNFESFPAFEDFLTG